jgi:hypothetical protein
MGLNRAYNARQFPVGGINLPALIRFRRLRREKPDR